MITLGEAADADDVVFGRFTSDGKTTSLTANVLRLAPPSLSPSFTATGSPLDLLSVHLRLCRLFALCDLAGSVSIGRGAGGFFRARASAVADGRRSPVRSWHGRREDDDRIADLRDAARLEADWDTPAFELGVTHYRRHDCEMALVWLSRVPPGRPHGAEAGFDAGVCHLQGHDPARAESAFEVVFEQPRPGSEMPPDSPEARNNLGVAEAQQGKLADAISQFEKATQVAEGTAKYWFNLGLAQASRGTRG